MSLKYTYAIKKKNKIDLGIIEMLWCVRYVLMQVLYSVMCRTICCVEFVLFEKISQVKWVNFHIQPQIEPGQSISEFVLIKISTLPI